MLEEAEQRTHKRTRHSRKKPSGMMQSISRFFYGPGKEERVREVQRRLRQEQRSLDREIRQIDQAVMKVKADVKRLARKGDVRNATVLAKEVVRSTKHRTRLVTSKSQLNSISLQLQQQLCTYPGAWARK
mgnify:FL=1